MENEQALGLDVFYPIVPDVDWVARLVPEGVKTIQLRIKDADVPEVKRQIAESLSVANRYGCQLIVNDYWKEAIETGANYIHLGQDDLVAADLSAIKAAGLRLGISTHSEEELAIALSVSPDYVALGPVYPTKLKVMKWAPQGLARVGDWNARIGHLPLVAIGGITVERAPGVLAAGAQSIAVITDFMTAADPIGRVKVWLDWADTVRRDFAASLKSR